MAKYERGEAEPTASALAAYNQNLGVNANWLVTGQGEVFDDPSKAPPVAFDGWTMRRMAVVVTATYKEAGDPITPENVAVEAGNLYNELVGLVVDPADRDEVLAALPLLRRRLKKRLAEAASEPGSGKRSVS